MQFKKDLLDGLKPGAAPAGSEATYDFAEVVRVARARCEKRFQKAAKEALVDGTDWSWEEEAELLKEEVQSVADQCRKDETKKMVNVIEVRSYLEYTLAVLSVLVAAQLQEANLGASRNIPEQAVTGHVGQDSQGLP